MLFLQVMHHLNVTSRENVTPQLRLIFKTTSNIESIHLYLYMTVMQCYLRSTVVWNALNSFKGVLGSESISYDFFIILTITGKCATLIIRCYV